MLVVIDLVYMWHVCYLVKQCVMSNKLDFEKYHFFTKIRHNANLSKSCVPAPHSWIMKAGYLSRSLAQEAAGGEGGGAPLHLQWFPSVIDTKRANLMKRIRLTVRFIGNIYQQQTECTSANSSYCVSSFWLFCSLQS